MDENKSLLEEVDVVLQSQESKLTWKVKKGN